MKTDVRRPSNLELVAAPWGAMPIRWALGALQAVLVMILLLLPLRLEAQRFQVLHSFGSSGEGIVPAGALAADPVGNLYGTTGGPDEYGHGVAFELSTQVGGDGKRLFFMHFPASSIIRSSTWPFSPRALH